MQRVTQADIAKALNISQPTVGLVVGRTTGRRGKEKLRPETIERILKKAEEMGYRPHRHAQIMRHGKAALIGLVYSGGLLSVASERAVQVTRILKERGYGIVSYDTQWHRGGIQEALAYMDDSKVAGVLMAGNFYLPEEVRCQEEWSLPLVGVAAPEIAGTSLVRCDMRAGTLQITEHMLTQGCRLLVHLSAGEADVPLENWRWQRARLAAGFQDAVLAAGGRVVVCRAEDYQKQVKRVAGGSGPLGVILCQSELERELPAFDPFFRGAEMAKSLLGRAPLPEAVVCPNDDWAYGFAIEVLRAGHSIPRDVAVAGFNDSALGQRFLVPLTTVRQPTQAMCELAVRLLLDEIDGKPSAPRTYDLPGELIVRASSIKAA